MSAANTPDGPDAPNAPDHEPVFRMTVLYPERLNLYADRGNVLVLARRCERRRIRFELTAVGIGDPFGRVQPDLVYIGGGQDRDQRACSIDLQRHREALVAAASAGGTVLGICGGYQLLGHEYATPDGTVSGLGMLDVVTTRLDGPRLVGNMVVAVDPELGLGSRVLVGFENHQGRTELGDGSRPLGSVVTGSGNNGHDGGEGAATGSVIGTYLHGPLLAKNAWFADHLIERAIGGPLPAIDDRFADAVHARAVDAALAAR